MAEWMPIKSERDLMDSTSKLAFIGVCQAGEVEVGPVWIINTTLHVCCNV